MGGYKAAVSTLPVSRPASYTTKEGEFMKKALLIAVTLVLGACAKNNDSFPSYTQNAVCYGIDNQENAYSLIVNAANNQQEVIARFNQQEQHNFFLVEQEPYAVFNDVVLRTSGVYVNNVKLEMEYICE